MLVDSECMQLTSQLCFHLWFHRLQLKLAICLSDGSESIWHFRHCLLLKGEALLVILFGAPLRRAKAVHGGAQGRRLTEGDDSRGTQPPTSRHWLVWFQYYIQDIWCWSPFAISRVGGGVAAGWRNPRGRGGVVPTWATWLSRGTWREGPIAARGSVGEIGGRGEGGVWGDHTRRGERLALLGHIGQCGSDMGGEDGALGLAGFNSTGSADNLLVIRGQHCSSGYGVSESTDQHNCVLVSIQ